MSGGVDSSVAAALLLEQGYEVIGCFMRLGSPGEAIDAPTLDAACDASAKPLRIGKQGCCSINDTADARQVAASLGIPLYVCNFKKDFGRIIDYFVDEYAQGRTPNPCVRCNDWLKFGKLHDYAKQLGASFVASGHYARVERIDGSLRLLRGVDEDRDQSYVLFGVPPEHLETMLLPVGAIRKPHLREMARARGLIVSDKPDSQEICFVPDNDYAGLVERTGRGSGAGRIVDPAGKVVGEHAGQHHFTIGQRRGLDLALGYRIYVTGRDAATNTVTVGPREMLLRTGCVAGEANWLAKPLGTEWTPCMAQYRYNSDAVPARVRGLEDSPGPTTSGRCGRFEVLFDEPQEAVAPGQAVVLYEVEATDVVIGGGWIESAHAAPVDTRM